MIDLEALKAGLAEYDPNSPKCPLQIVRHRTDHDPFSGDYDMVTHSPCCRPEGHEGECRNSRSVMGWPDFSTVSALLAEIERLRAIIGDQQILLDEHGMDNRHSYEEGGSGERAAVVERLRGHRKSCTENLLKGCAMSQGFAPSRAERETRRFVQVQRLRHATGATRTECEHALTECRGDTDAAIEWLRRQVRQ